jgi:hypothetical protein
MGGSQPKTRNLPKKYKLSAKPLAQKENIVPIKLEYKSETGEGMYLGISVIRDGVSLGGIITSRQKLLRRSGHIYYNLDVSGLNGGVYYIGAGLFKAKNRELLAASDKVSFIVKGSDDTRDSALKLADNWKYE